MPTTGARLRRALGVAVRCQADAPEGDAEFVRRFVADRDEAAFEALVRRHGPMVLGVCRRILRDPHAAEDAFQATFLQLARRAGSVRRAATLAGWLYTAARRSALRARARRPEPPTMAPAHTPADPLDALSARELLALIDEEVARLPERYRLPVVLCYLDGLTKEQAARRLGWEIGVLRGRLERGRLRLRVALVRRGVAPAAGLVLLAPLAGPAPSAELVAAAVGAATGRVVSPAVAALAAAGGAGVVVRSAVAVALAVGLGGVMAAAALAPAPDPGKGDPPAAAPPAAETAKGGDLYGDPLPVGAVARLGTVRFRHAGFSDYVFLPDGKTVLTAGGDGVLRFWDTATGRTTRTVALEKAADPAQAVTLSPDGKLLVAHAGKQLVFWEVKTGKVLKSLPGPEKNLGFLYFSPDGTWLTVGTWARRISLLDWKAGQEREVPLPTSKIGMDSTFHACFSPDGKRLIAGGGSGESLCVFDLPDLREAYRLECHASTSVVSPDGKTLAVSCIHPGGGGGGDLKLFDLATGKETASFPTVGHYYSLAFSPDGKALALGFSDDSCVMDLATGKVKYRLTGRPISMAFSPDGKTLAGGTGARLRFWDAQNGKELHERPGDVGFTPAVAVSPDGKLVVTADWLDRAVSVWDAGTGRLLRQLPLKSREGRYVRNLAFTPDGKTLTACDYNGLLQTWEVGTWAARRSVQLNDPARPNPNPVYYYALLLSPDGRRVATLERVFGNPDGEATALRFWDATTGTLLREHAALPGESREAVWVDDGPSVALPLKDGLKVVDLATGKERFTAPGVKGSPIAASPDGRLVAACKGKPAAVTVWEVATGREVATVPTGPVRYLRLGPDDRTLVTADARSFEVWDLATGRSRLRRTLPAAIPDWARPYEDRLVLSPDGRRAVTALGDGTGLIWDVTAPAGEPLVKRPTEAQVAGWWADLAGTDAAKAYAAVWRLADAPAESVPLLARHLKPAPGPDPDMVRRLVRDLDGDAFDVRERATKKLAELGPAAGPALRRALEAGPSPEARERIERLLGRLTNPAATPDALRRLRAVLVLERAGSPEARRVLAELAEGSTHAREAEEAKAALGRLSRRPPDR